MLYNLLGIIVHSVILILILILISARVCRAFELRAGQRGSCRAPCTRGRTR
ncbi:MAG: hypothetical protein F2681_15045 [Actinobacteria bacterium]|nr:hypothetical protein [Actinomycetota bacterium]MTB19436.1 hypothetical protein [Actinomycetota bacterium]